MKKAIAFLFLFLFVFPVFSSQKYIYSEEEYTRFVEQIFVNRLKKFNVEKVKVSSKEQKKDFPGYKTTFKYRLSSVMDFKFILSSGRVLLLSMDLLEPPFHLNDDMKAYADSFLSKYHIKTVKTEYLFQMVNYFEKNPTEIEYIWNLTINAEGVYKYRMGNCFAFTNYFVGLARYVGLKAYYYYVPKIQASYLSRDTLITTSHIVCGIDIGRNKIPFVIDFIPDTKINYENFFKTNRIKKITDLQAAGLFYCNLGAKAMLQRQYNNAELFLLLADGLYPHSPIILNNLGVLYKKMGNYSLALEKFKKALKYARHPQKIVANIIKMKEEIGKKMKGNKSKLAENLRKINKTIERMLEENYYWHLKKANDFMKEKRYKEALSEIEKADKLSPHNQEVYIYFMRLASITGDKNLYEKYKNRLKQVREIQ